ncbi:MAG: glycosyltransferase family 9 protein [Candidatus Desulfofervidaceae bacterium]|nr:glycosyltransferase family 9 protein [Candidatus Desulfofervidaceae bacterium]MDL1970949.1 glycosyltransferase family 9 protein [Candidatus Desulfofervidaceae bacterium]
MIKLSSLGDIIHTLPALNALKKAYPQAEIDWVTEEVGMELLSGHPYINQLLLYKRYEWPEALKKGSWVKVLKEVVGFKDQLQKGYNLVIDFQGLLKSAVIAWLARGNKKIGFANGREGSHFSFHKKYKANYNEHAVIRYLKLLQFAGIPVDFNEIVFSLPPAPAIDFKLKAPYIVINPTARWPSKMWFKEKWAALGKDLLKLGYKVVFTGAKADKVYVDAICSDCSSAINLAGKTNLKSLISLYKQAHLIISVDTGTMHLAAAAGNPVIALFGPTAPWRTGPFGKGHTVIYKSLSCQPCFRKDCKDKACLKDIEVEEIIEAVKRY